MAGMVVKVNIPSKALSANTPTTVGFVTSPTNQRVKIKAFGLFFDGQLNTAQPVEIKIARPTAGTLTAGGTGIKQEPELTETIQTTFGLAASVEPTLTASLVAETITIHPQFGYEYIAPMGDEDWVAGGTNYVWSANAPATVNIRGYIKFEE